MTISGWGTLMPTRRLLIFWLVAAPLAALADVWPALEPVVWGMVGLSGLLVLVDLWLSPRPGDFTVARRHAARFSTGSSNGIELVLGSRADRAVMLRLYDILPPVLRVERPADGVLTVELPARGEVTVRYEVYPLQRGRCVLDAVALRWSGRLGLIEREARIAVSTEVKVYPNLHDVQIYERLLRRGGTPQGVHTERWFGEGSEFEQLRAYQPGDDWRRIAWKATAHGGRPISVEFQSERHQSVMIGLDLGRQMLARPAPNELTRLDRVINAVLLFSYVALRKGDHVGLLAFSDAVRLYLPPRSGRRHFYEIMERLYEMEATAVESDYGLALDYLRLHCRRRSLVMLFTSPATPGAARQLAAHLRPFYPHHLPLCVSLNDPPVLACTQTAPRNLEEVYRRAVAGQLLDERQVGLDWMARQGILTLDVPDDQLTPAVINKYLEIKARSRL